MQGHLMAQLNVLHRHGMVHVHRSSMVLQSVLTGSEECVDGAGDADLCC